MKRERRKGWNRRILALFLSLLMVMGTALSGCSMDTYAVETSQKQSGSLAESASQEENTEPEGSVAAEAESTEAEEEESEPSDSEAENVAEEAADPETGEAAQQAVQADGNSSSGVNLDVTATLNIDGGKTTVQAGETFQLQIQYSVPELGADQGNAFSGGQIQFYLPSYLQVDQTEAGEYRIEGQEVTNIMYTELAGLYTVELNNGESLTSNSTNTVTVTLVTDNLLTPDNTELVLDGFSFHVSYRDSTNVVTQQTIPVPTTSTTVEAASDWQVEKSIVSEDAENQVSYIRNGDYFDVTYQLTVTDEDGVNRLGRLGFETYALTDDLPTGLPEGGEAAEVLDVKILHGSTEMSLTEGTDYTLETADGAITGITFTTLDTMQEGDSLGQYQEVGDVTNTTYQYTVRYPYEPYTTDSTELEIQLHTLTNTATLAYTLVGGVAGSDTAEASFDIAAYEDDVVTANLAVEKHLSVGGEDVVLNADQAAVYGNAAFTLYTDPECTNVAYNTLRQQMSGIQVDENGTAVFSNIRYGTYYIKETQTPAGFASGAVVKVLIDEKGAVFFDDSTEADADQTVVVTNVAESVGTLRFTKQGSDAYGNTGVALSGVEFTLTGADGTAYTATSGADGQVIFRNIPAGTYTLTETAVPEALQEQGYTVSDKSFSVEVKANEVNVPELDGSNIFVNESPKGLLQIQKVDAQSASTKLAGAVFQLYGPYETGEEALAALADLSGAALAATLTTGSDGTVTSGPLEGGYYVLQETEAPVNYTAGAPQVVQVLARETKTITVENDPQAQVRITKQGAADEQSPSQELAGATFEIYDEAGNQLYGVRDTDGNFTDVSTETEEGREAVVITTYLDSTGRSTSPYVTLSPGTYQYKETAAPAPYTPDSSLHSFTVADVAPSDAAGSWNLAQTVIVDNYLQVGQIRIVKEANDADPAWTAEQKAAALNGAVFGVYATREAAEAGTLENAADRVDTITTGTVAEGEQTLYGIGYSTASLEIGVIYYVKELSAPAGYDVNSDIEEVTCTADSKLVTVTCTNERTVSIQIQKTDSVLNTALAGASFELYTAVSDGNGGWTAGTKIDSGSTGTDGTLTFGNLSPNTTYIVREIAAPDGYVLDTKDFEVTTGADASAPVSLAVSNTPEGTLTVEKHDLFDQDDGGYALFGGVAFTLYQAGAGVTAEEDAATEAAFEADTGKTEIGSQTTGTDGKASWTGLTPGYYWLRETLPVGYGSTDTQTAYSYRVVYVKPGENVEGYNRTDVEVIDNTAVMGKIQIGKYAFDAEGNVDQDTPLDGVVFGVYTSLEAAQSGTAASDTDRADTLTTDSQGTALSGWLAPGTYYVKELAAKDGYVLADTIYMVTVEANKTAVTGQINGSTQTQDLQSIGNEKLGGFTIQKYGAFLSGTDGEGNPTEVLEQLSGATFALYPYVESVDDSLTGTPQLDENPKTPEGEARQAVQSFTMASYQQAVSNLEPGVYWLRETAAPDETWDKVADTLIQVLPDGTVRCGTLGEDGQVTWSEASSSLTLTLKDYSNKPRIRFTKTVYGEDTTIDGARFELYQEVTEGTPGAKEVVVNSNGDTKWVVSVCDSNGDIWVIDSGDAQDQNGNQLHGQAVTPKLDPGYTYWLKEIELVGDNNKWNYYFDEENCWTSVTIPSEAEGQEFSVEIENYRRIHLPGEKYDPESNTKLSGSLVAVFRDKTLADAMVVRMQEYPEWDAEKCLEISDIYNTETGTLTDTAEAWGILQVSISNGNGQYSFENLIPGETYYIMELVAPNGYQLEKDDNGNVEYHTVVVNPDYDGTSGDPFLSVDGDENTNTLRIANYDFNQIVLDKVSVLSGQEYRISGATFTIYGSKTENGQLVPDTENEVGVMVESNDSGQYRSNHLPNGIYWLEETVPPTGFKEKEDRDALTADELQDYGTAAYTDSQGNSYDYIELNGKRYYKVVLGRDTDNTWFTEEGGHEIYNEADVGRFALTKVSSEDKATLVEATFSIEKYDEASGVFVTYTDYASITTETDEAYVLSNFLEPGIYKLTETETDDRYTEDTTPVYIQIAAGKMTDGSNWGAITIGSETVEGYRPADSTATDADGNLANPIQVENVPKGQFWIHKTGTWNGGTANGGTTEDLSGVSFEIYQNEADASNEDMEPLATITTNDQGIAVSPLLDAGTYWVIERSVSASDQAEYGKAEDSYKAFAVSVTSGTTTQTPSVTTEVENTSNLGKFTVTKEDAYTHERLSGATLEIYNNADCTGEPVGTMTDNKDGTYTSPLLAPGVYWLKETEAPSGYYLPEEGIIFGGEDADQDGQSDGFTVTANSLTTVAEALPNHLENSLTIYKYEQRGDRETEDLITTSSATFALYETEEAAENATAENPGTPLRSGNTGTTGTITWTGLPNGTYYLKELAGPSGYAADLDTVYTIVLNNETADRQVEYEQKIYNLLLGGFNLDKTVTWDNTAGYVAGSDITFDLYQVKQDGTRTHLAELTTDDNGRISYRMEAGDYVLVERMTEDYSRDSSQYGEDTDGDGNYIDSEGNIHIRVEASVINEVFTGTNAVNNIPNYGRFQLMKKTKTSEEDQTGIGLSGAQYTLEKYNEETGTWEYVGGSEEASIFNVTEDLINGVSVTGAYLSGHMTPGKYRVTEVTAPNSQQNSDGVTVNFTVDPTPIEFTITAGTTAEMEQWDGILRTLRVSKTTDEKNGSQPLSGVTFELWTWKDASEEGLETDYDKAAAHADTLVETAKTTGADGVVAWQNLEPGRYVLLETDAPEGYVRTAQVVEVKESTSYLDVTYDLNVVNESNMGRIIIQKTDEEGNVICDEDGLTAVFAIYDGDADLSDPECTPVTTVTVSGDGTGESGLLPMGDYWVVEIQAPEGYPLDDRLDQNILAKQVTVSGDQNPTVDFTGVSPTASQGYTDLVIFQNRTAGSVGTLTSSLDKDVRVENSGTSYAGTGSAHSEASLMNEAVSVWFLLSGLTDGQNDLPLTSFVVTDETMDFQGLTEGSTDAYYSYESGDALTAEDYTFDQIRLYKSVNESSTAVLATVEAKVNGQWQTVQTDIDLTNLADNGYQTVDLPEGATGFRVSYANVEAGFLAGNIEVQATFAQRPSDASAPEIRRIVNTATLSWEDTAVNHQGEASHNTGTVSDSASVTFSSYTENLPILSLHNQITSSGTAAGYYYAGDTVEFETTGTVLASSQASLRHPVMSVTLPPYTTLDEGLYSADQGGIQGIRAILSSEGETDQILTFTLSEPIQVTVEMQVDTDGDGVTETVERTCWQYVLDFGEDFVLEPGQSISIQYGAAIDLSLPDTVITLEALGYIGSGYQLPLTLENPTGMSYRQASTDSSSVVDSSEIAGAVGGVAGEDGLTCLEQPVSLEITRSDSLQIYKSIGVEEGEWLSRGVTAEVEPGGTLYYQLSLVNAGDAVKEARFVDIIPFTGDTMEYRSLSDNGVLSQRSTSLPVSDGEHTYEQVELLWVNGNPDGVEGAHVTIYYYVGGSWDEETRLSQTGSEELPMLASKAEDVWGGRWTTTPPEDLSQVTAVGVEVTFEEGTYLEAGDVYNVTLAMRAPGYTADEMAAYEDALIGNTTAAAVVRASDTESSPMLATDRVSSNEVLAELYMTTGSIGDYAFYDNNDNGVQDEGDRPVRNLEVNLYRRKSTTDGGEGEWELYATTYTDANGEYLFEDLACNYRTEESYEDGSGYEEDPTNPAYYIGNTYYEYRVEFAIPDGYGAATRYAGDDTALDSNIDENGQTEAVSLALTMDGEGNLVGETNLTIDAGFVSLVSLGDYVWIDSNKNGIQDESETGLNGVTVNLYRLESAEDSLDGLEPYATQITATNDASGTDGYYCFTGLPKGLYVVEFDMDGVKTGGYTASYAFTTAEAGSFGADSDAKHSQDGSGTVMYTDVIDLQADNMTIDAGVTVYSALGGFVFDDQDYDNTQSVYLPLPGTQVELYTVGDDGTVSEEPIATTVVGEDGTYLFDRLDAGRYRIYFRYPENYISVEAGVGDAEHDSEVAYFDDETLNGGFTDIIELPADTADLTHDAGAYLLSSIGDYVWVDADQDGLQDEGEEPVSGVIVTLQQRTGEGEWETAATSVTDETGHYLFTGLRSSDIYDVEYRVTFNLSLLASLTSPYQGEDAALDSNALFDYEVGLGYLTDPVKPGYGQSDLTIDAGIYYVDDPCTVGDYVWLDADQDGVQDSGETGVEGITVILQYNASGNVWEEDAWETVATTVTNSEGQYLFQGLPSGYYRVGFAVGDPWTVTLTNRGDTATDSNATVQGDGYYYSMSFYMNPGQTDLTWDAGIYRPEDVERPTTITTIINRVVTGVRTGDPTAIGALAAVMAASAGAVVLLIRRKRKKMNAE